MRWIQYVGENLVLEDQDVMDLVHEEDLVVEDPQLKLVDVSEFAEKANADEFIEMKE